MEEELVIGEEKIKRLQRRLRRHENSHTPPSRRLGSSRRRKRTYRENESKGKRGHGGTTRPRSEPDRTKVLMEKCCTNCGAELGEPSHIETRIIEDIHKPQGVKATEFKIGHYKCSGCGEKFVASYEDFRRKGGSGTTSSSK